MDYVVLTCIIITIQLLKTQFMNLCKIFLSPFGLTQMAIPPQSLPYWDVKISFKPPLKIYCSLIHEFISYNS